MVDYSGSNYHEKRHGELLADLTPREAWSHYAEAAYFADVPDGADVLEFGGSLGNNLIALSRRARVAMVEPSSLGRETAAASGIAAFESLADLAGEHYDLILCRHVLEHLISPADYLVQMRAALKPAGRLRQVLAFENPDDRPRQHELDHYLYIWSWRTITNLLEATGYTVREQHIEHANGRQMLLPVYQRFGPAADVRLSRVLGRLRGCRELVTTAAPADGEDTAAAHPVVAGVAQWD